jgi:hypothetical protein
MTLLTIAGATTIATLLRIAIVEAVKPTDRPRSTRPLLIRARWNEPPAPGSAASKPTT